MNGLSLRQFLAYANLQLGDVTLPEWDKVSLLADAVSTAFESGQPSQFAQDHLRLPGDFSDFRCR